MSENRILTVVCQYKPKGRRCQRKMNILNLVTVIGQDDYDDNEDYNYLKRE
jgi:hypothetical protein